GGLEALQVLRPGGDLRAVAPSEDGVQRVADAAEGALREPSRRVADLAGHRQRGALLARAAGEVPHPRLILAGRHVALDAAETLQLLAGRLPLGGCRRGADRDEVQQRLAQVPGAGSLLRRGDLHVRVALTHPVEKALQRGVPLAATALTGTNRPQQLGEISPASAASAGTEGTCQLRVVDHAVMLPARLSRTG